MNHPLNPERTKWEKIGPQAVNFTHRNEMERQAAQAELYAAWEDFLASANLFDEISDTYAHSKSRLRKMTPARRAAMREQVKAMRFYLHLLTQQHVQPQKVGKAPLRALSTHLAPYENNMTLSAIAVKAVGDFLMILHQEPKAIAEDVAKDLKTIHHGQVTQPELRGILEYEMSRLEILEGFFNDFHGIDRIRGVFILDAIKQMQGTYMMAMADGQITKEELGMIQKTVRLLNIGEFRKAMLFEERGAEAFQPVLSRQHTPLVGKGQGFGIG